MCIVVVTQWQDYEGEKARIEKGSCERKVPRAFGAVQALAVRVHGVWANFVAAFPRRQGNVNEDPNQTS